MLAGSIYWTCTAVVLHFGVYSDKIAATASLPLIIVHLFGIQALWIACIIGYLTCFASLNVYAQSFARLIWTQMQYQPDHYLAQLSPGRLPLHALNVILACCCVSSLVVYALKINLNALIVYANGILLCSICFVCWRAVDY